MQRFIDIDFNRLETTVNLQTWVVLLDFLGLGAKAHDPEQFSQERKQRHRSGSTLHQLAGKQRHRSGSTLHQLAGKQRHCSGSSFHQLAGK